MKRLIKYLKQLFAIHNVSVSVVDKGSCRTCRFNDKENDMCTAGTYYAKKGINEVCYSGELWQATER